MLLLAFFWLHDLVGDSAQRFGPSMTAWAMFSREDTSLTTLLQGMPLNPKPHDLRTSPSRLSLPAISYEVSLSSVAQSALWWSRKYSMGHRGSHSSPLGSTTNLSARHVTNTLQVSIRVSLARKGPLLAQPLMTT
ncbi:hypothetical protein HER10_EVM0006403 [Colletotrichum scovillei]|uniref:uncharacterized protein n=1 Tax=Colletotrichum scovillei TaxID=1209932 RepID=UPI0015C39267|nr:uncharacterized protein HER10_EVM0006403 [Colletotrichum scovillei]KAF4773910.1 hypothetical protein HER10_EVM0006403 [Colletotrichum scovillei]